MNRTAGRIILGAAIVVTVTACGDRRLGKLTEGISKDSVAVVMGTDTPYREEQYLTEGKNWEILMYAREDSPADTIPWRKLSPVVLADQKVVGWGWSYWEKEAERLKIPVPADD